jgi:hypothetical protein
MRTDPRFRRNLSFSVAALGGLLLLSAGAVHYRSFHATLEQNARAVLDKEWGTMKGYLRLERGPRPSVVQANWYYDDQDPDQTAAVKGLRNRCVIVDGAGRTLQEPASFPEMRNRLAGILSSLDSPDTAIITEIKHDGARYLVRAGVLSDEHRSSRFPAALMVRLHEEATGFSVSLLGAVFGALLLGWSIARGWSGTPSSPWIS